MSYPYQQGPYHQPPYQQSPYQQPPYQQPPYPHPNQPTYPSQQPPNSYSSPYPPPASFGYPLPPQGYPMGAPPNFAAGPQQYSYGEKPGRLQWLRTYAPSSLNLNQSMQQAFQKADLDHSGAISKQELAEALRMLGEDCTQDTVESLFEMFDLDDNGVIDYEEFGELWGYLQSVKRSFEETDHQKTGAITYEQSNTALKKTIPILSSIPGVDPMLNSLYSKFDTKGKGSFHLGKFVKIACAVGAIVAMYFLWKHRHSLTQSSIMPDMGSFFSEKLGSDKIASIAGKKKKGKKGKNKDKKDKKGKKDKKSKKEK